jgi:NAD(P)H-hydrate epimerase
VAAVVKDRPELEVIALDIPSGLDADNGSCDHACLHASHTITLGFPKPGLFNLPGAGRAGVITVVDIGIPECMANDTIIELITDDWARSVLPGRPLEANKGNFGKVMVIAGSKNYIGAACLACSGAMRVGVGLVTLAAAGSLHSIMATKLTEVTHLPLPEAKAGTISAEAVNMVMPLLTDYKAVLVGCGMGKDEAVMAFNRSLLLQSKYKLPPLVLDADAINTLAETPRWWQQLTDNAILTPHAAEMSRLTGMAVKDIQANRAGVAAGVAVEWAKTVVLKGAYTVIAAADGRRSICPSANPGLASAGTGDVLAGAIAGLLAQGLKPFDAARLAVWLHAKAGEVVKEELGDSGIIAGDLLPLLPKVIKKLKAVKNGRKI